MIGSPLSQGGWVQPYDENDTGIGRGFLHFVGRFIKERGSMLLIERLRFTFTPNGKREFVPRDQVFPYFPFTIYCFYTRISSFMPVLTIGIVRGCFYLLIFYSEKFST